MTEIVQRLRANDAEIYLPILGEAADYIEAIIAKKEAARMEERAAIVAWLRNNAGHNGKTNLEADAIFKIFGIVASSIEAVEHLK